MFFTGFYYVKKNNRFKKREYVAMHAQNDDSSAWQDRLD